MSVESISSSVVCSAPSISSAPSLGGEIGSSSSFADTIPLSAPTEFSLGGTFDSSLTSFSDLQQYSFLEQIHAVPDTFYTGLAGVNLDPDIADVAEIAEITEVPQGIQNTFTDNFVEEIYSATDNLESILEPKDIVDIPIIEPQSSDIEQIIYQSEPIIDQVEAEKAADGFGLVASGLEQEIVNNEPELTDFSLPTTAEQVVEEAQGATTEIIDQIAASSDFVESPRPSAIVSEALRAGNDILEVVNVDNYEISEPALVEVVNELAILTETPVSPEVITQEQLVTPEITPINYQTNPETIQATKTYQAFVTAGVEKTLAIGFVEEALAKIGIEPNVVRQIMVEVQTKQQIKTEHQVKPTQAKAKVSSQAIKVEPAVAEAMAGKEEEIEKEEEEEKKKKRRFKFIKDKIALAHIFKAWKKAVGSAPSKKETGKDVIDSIDALVLMPTEVQNSGVKSGILPKFVLEWLNFGDGAYRTALAMAKDIGLQSRQVILEKVLALHQKYYPVTIAEDGEEATKSNVELVLTYKPNPIGNSRNLI